MATKEELEAQLQEAAEQVAGKIQEIKDAVTDYVGDVQAGFKKLQDAIEAGTQGPDLAPFLASLAASVGSGTAIVEAIKTADTKAEEVSGVPTPPAV